MSAPEQLITENLDIWTDAIKPKAARGRGRGKGKNSKQEFYGIKKLRELILELAVRGLLVPQDTNDAHAHVLLKKITDEKEKLLKEKKIKKQKALSSISNEEMPFELPQGWVWVRFQDVSEYIQRGKGPKYSDFGKIRVVSQKCIQWSGFDLTSARYVEDTSLDTYQPERFLQTNDLLWNSTGTGTVGRINLVDEIDDGSLVADSHVTVIRTLCVNTSFVWSYVSSPGVQSRIEPTHENALVSGSTNQVELNTSTVINLVLPIPPKDEQHRIVAKVGELMVLCDQLEQQTETSLTAHQTLVETLLGTLINAANNSAFEEAWQRIVEHFDTLFTTEHSIDQLKQIILQLAVMGKLVPQDPNDDPANKLLKKIAIEKENLIKEKKIKKQRVHLPISDEEKLFNLPVGWEWERLQNLSVVGTGSTPSRDNFNFYNPPEFNWVTSGETSEDFIYKTKEKVAEKAIQETNVSIYPVGTLIVAMYGQGKTRGQVTELMIEAGTNQACAAIQLIESSKEHRGYIKLFFKKAYEELRSHAAGGAQPNLNVGKVSSTVIPMPPLKEQHRIVAKVDELIALCDQLNVRLVEAQTTQLYLADAMAEQAVT